MRIVSRFREVFFRILGGRPHWSQHVASIVVRLCPSHARVLLSQRQSLRDGARATRGGPSLPYGSGLNTPTNACTLVPGAGYLGGGQSPRTRILGARWRCSR